eukprot:jgi/Tetstr1/454586/TSEL_041480.t1
MASTLSSSLRALPRLSPHLAPRLRSCSAPSPAVFRSSARNNSMATVAGALGRLQMERSALFVCDVQERFRPVIADMPAVIDTTARMVRGCAEMNIPIIVTEQY